MKLYAISDLHVGYKINRQALEALPSHSDDWLILAGDIGETQEHLHFTLNLLSKRFARLFWVPGNHDLWSTRNQQLGNDIDSDEERLHGEEKYQALVAICRQYGVMTPEDPYTMWTGAGGPALLVPLFVLYDYSFRPAHVTEEKAVAWAEETNVVCSDEYHLHPDPYPSRSAWCHERCRYSKQRLQEIPAGTPLILINHFPLRERLVRLKRIPRFSLWCGTKLTDDWHTRFPASVVVYGHVHMRATDYQDHVRFEEVSLGYPPQWRQEQGVEAYLREILPGPQHSPEQAGPIWHW